MKGSTCIPASAFIAVAGTWKGSGVRPPRSPVRGLFLLGWVVQDKSFTKIAPRAVALTQPSLGRHYSKANLCAERRNRRSLPNTLTHRAGLDGPVDVAKTCSNAAVGLREAGPNISSGETIRAGHAAAIVVPRVVCALVALLRAATIVAVAGRVDTRSFRDEAPGAVCISGKVRCRRGICHCICACHLAGWAVPTQMQAARTQQKRECVILTQCR